MTGARTLNRALAERYFTDVNREYIKRVWITRPLSVPFGNLFLLALTVHWSVQHSVIDILCFEGRNAIIDQEDKWIYP